ncbi:MAG TPA: hypothetical protein VGE85_04985 [Terracidiphilus sp.]|jgi:hypothetical protein
MPGKSPLRETAPDTTYAVNMRRYIEEARTINVKAMCESGKLSAELKAKYCVMEPSK